MINNLFEMFRTFGHALIMLNLPGIDDIILTSIGKTGKFQRFSLLFFEKGR